MPSLAMKRDDGSISPLLTDTRRNSCLDEGAEECERCDSCETLQVWKDLYETVNQVIDNVTIADPMARRRKREGNLDYSI